MGLPGVEGNLAWFCNLDSQERLCELVEEPGFKSRTGEVSFPASHGLPSWWPGKRRGPAGPVASVTGGTHSTGARSLWQVICWEGGRAA